MTVVPAWVRAAIDVDGLALTDSSVSSEESDWANPRWRKLGPLTQEKGDPHWGSLLNDSWEEVDFVPYAGFTCASCPQRERYYRYSIRVEGKEGHYDQTIHNYTSRCTECSRKMKRWQRGQKDAELVRIASECYEQGVSFVTLTMPNMVGDIFDNIRLFKRHVASFRKRFPTDAVSGGKDYYEFTIHPDDRAWSNPIVANVHMHGIWVMDYWDQESFQDSWSHGIAHLFRAKSGDAVRYATKYASKQDVKGIRLKESFGCLYGSARRALLEAYQVRQNTES